MDRIPRTRLAAAALVVLALMVALPITAAAGSRVRIGVHHLEASSSGDAFTFGRVDGLLPPWSVTIHNDGAVSAQGCVHLANPQLRLSADVLHGLLKLAEAERFFNLPNVLSLKRPLFDSAQVSITVHTTAGSKSVTLVGVIKPAFSELFDVLMMVAGATLPGSCG